MTNEQQKKVDKKLAEYEQVHAEYKVIEERLKDARKAWEKAYAAWLKVEYPDPDVDLTPEQFRQLQKHSHNVNSAYEFEKAWFAKRLAPLRRAGTMCWRGKQYESEMYTTPQISLKKNEDPTRHAEALRKFAAVVDEPWIHVSVFENSLSEYGIYAFDYTPLTDVAVLHKTTYGRREDLKSGPLLDVLVYIAAHHFHDEDYQSYAESEEDY